MHTRELDEGGERYRRDAGGCSEHLSTVARAHAHFAHILCQPSIIHLLLHAMTLRALSYFLIYIPSTAPRLPSTIPAALRQADRAYTYVCLGWCLVGDGAGCCLPSQSSPSIL